MSVTILIAEDDPLLRAFLTDVLAGHPEIRVLGSVGDGREVLAAANRLKPQIVLLDLHLPGLAGLKVLELLLESENPPRVLVLSGDEANETQLEAARGGAKGFLPKSQAISKLADAIQAVASGGMWFAPQVVEQIFNEYPRLVRRTQQMDRPVDQLSAREREVLICVARGMTNQQIARELFMSLSTVKVHLHNVFQKLNLPNRTEAAVFAVREGLLIAKDAAEEK